MLESNESRQVVSLVLLIVLIIGISAMAKSALTRPPAGTAGGCVRVCAKVCGRVLRVCVSEAVYVSVKRQLN